MSHFGCTDNATAEKLISIPKQYSRPVSWALKESNHGFLEIKITPEDPSDPLGAPIPGMMIRIEYSIPKRINIIKYSFTLQALLSGGKPRAFQLEIFPYDQKSSAHKEPIYGPHVHIGTDVELPDVQYDITDFDAWCTWFCTKINLVMTHKVPSPFSSTTLELEP